MNNHVIPVTDIPVQQKSNEKHDGFSHMDCVEVRNQTSIIESDLNNTKKNMAQLFVCYSLSSSESSELAEL